jgi:hypothetical protein
MGLMGYKPQDFKVGERVYVVTGQGLRSDGTVRAVGAVDIAFEGVEVLVTVEWDEGDLTAERAIDLLKGGR